MGAAIVEARLVGGPCDGQVLKLSPSGKVPGDLFMRLLIVVCWRAEPSELVMPLPPPMRYELVTSPVCGGDFRFQYLFAQ